MAWIIVYEWVEWVNEDYAISYSFQFLLALGERESK